MNDNVKHRQLLEKSTIITIEDTFEFKKEEFEKLPISKKLSAMWNQQYIELSIFRFSYVIGIFVYFYLSISELCIMRNYVLDVMIELPEKRFWFRVGCCYLWYIMTAHWLCVVFYNSYWNPNDKDLTLLKNKTLWNDYNESLKDLEPKRILNKSSMPPTNYKLRMLDYLPEEHSGLVWRFCVICLHDSPPRSHHCVVCNKCILKRDHHCFFTGQCIGYWNQRYFYFLCLFILINCTIALVFESHYIIHYSKIGSQSMWSSLLIFYSVYMWLWTAEIETHLFVIITHIYILPFIAAMCFGFVCMQSLIILKGKTFDEFKTDVNMKVNYGLFQRIQNVFGPFFLFNLFMPSQILFEQCGDGVDWPGLVNLDGLALSKQTKHLIDA